MKKRQWLKHKREKNIEKKIQKKFLFIYVYENKIHGVYIRKRLRPSWNRKGKLSQQTKLNNLKQKS